VQLAQVPDDNVEDQQRLSNTLESLQKRLLVLMSFVYQSSEQEDQDLEFDFDYAQTSLYKVAKEGTEPDVVAIRKTKDTSTIAAAHLQEAQEADEAVERACEQVLRVEASGVAEEVLSEHVAVESAVLSAVQDLLELKAEQASAFVAAEACAVRDAELQASGELAADLLHTVVHHECRALVSEELAEAVKHEQMRKYEEQRVEEEMEKELTAEIVQVIADAECSVLAAEELAARAKDAQREEEGRRAAEGGVTSEELAADRRRQDEQKIKQERAEAEDQQRLQQEIRSSELRRPQQVTKDLPAAPGSLSPAYTALDQGVGDDGGQHHGAFAEAISAALAVVVSPDVADDSAGSRGAEKLEDASPAARLKNHSASLLTPRALTRVGEMLVVEGANHGTYSDRTVSNEELALKQAVLEARQHLQRRASQMRSSSKSPERPTQPERVGDRLEPNRTPLCAIQRSENAQWMGSPARRNTRGGLAESGRLDWGTGSKEGGNSKAIPAPAGSNGGKGQTKRGFKASMGPANRKQAAHSQLRARQEVPVAERIARMQREVARIKAELAGKSKELVGVNLAGPWAQSDAAALTLPYARQFASPTRQSYLDQVRAKVEAKRRAQQQHRRQMIELENIYACEQLSGLPANPLLSRPPVKSSQKPAAERAQWQHELTEWRNNRTEHRQQEFDHGRCLQLQATPMVYELGEPETRYTEQSLPGQQRGRAGVEDVRRKGAQELPQAAPQHAPQPALARGAEAGSGSGAATGMERSRQMTPPLAVSARVLAGGEQPRPTTAPEGVGKQVGMGLQGLRSVASPLSRPGMQTKVAEFRLDSKLLLQEILEARRQLAGNRRIQRPSSASGTSLTLCPSLFYPGARASQAENLSSVPAARVCAEAAGSLKG
jgi:hypothetical protein